MNSYRSAVLPFLFASAVALGLASPVSAHPECGPDEVRGDMMKRRSERMELHHQKLHEALKLKPEQESSWKRLMDSEQPMARLDFPKREEMQKLTTPEREEKMLERMKERQARMADHLAALKDFYAALSPEQKKTFDDFHTGPRGMRHGPESRPSKTETP